MDTCREILERMGIETRNQYVSHKRRKLTAFKGRKGTFILSLVIAYEDNADHTVVVRDDYVFDNGYIASEDGIDIDSVEGSYKVVGQIIRVIDERRSS